MSFQNIFQTATDSQFGPAEPQVDAAKLPMTSLGCAVSANVKRRRAYLASFVLSHRTWFIALFQALLILGSLVAAWLLRFNFDFPDRSLLLSTAPVLILIRLVAIERFGLFHGWWRYTGIDDAIDIGKAIATGSVAFVFSMRVILGIVAFPRAIYVLEPLLSLVLLGGVRVCSRIFVDSARKDDALCKDVILIGAGAAAQMTIREIERPGSGYRAIACVDDDGSKRGIKIEGVPVLGTVQDLHTLTSGYSVDEVLIAVPSATGAQMRRFVDICGDAGVRFKTIPSLRAIIDGGVPPSQIRDVRLEDLLGREPVEIDLEAVRRKLQGRVVMITGAAGSIGSELCRQILRYTPAKVVCIDQNETAIFGLQNEFSESGFGSVVFCVADIADRVRMQAILAENKPDIIFHAAAYKHVPVMETNVYEAVKNNVFALMELLQLAEREGCANFILISSDKAVNPVNIMGATKRVCELIIASKPAKFMQCASVRFGNVLGSNGSVVPIFQKQLRDNQRLTVTHPEMTRFFMTTHEAVSLVLQAFCLGQHGETLVLDMGKPVRILDLAKTLIRLSGKSEHSVGIRFTGLREGEKLCEELSYPAEQIHRTPFAKIKRIVAVPRRWSDLDRLLHELMSVISVSDDAAIRAKIKAIVPEYSNCIDDLTAERQLAAIEHSNAGQHLAGYSDAPVSAKASPISAREQRI